MPNQPSTETPEETVIKYQRILQKCYALKSVLAELANMTTSLAQEPSVPEDVIKDFRDTLEKLQEAHGSMNHHLATQMMEELIPLGMEVLQSIKGKHDGGKGHDGKA